MNVDANAKRFVHICWLRHAQRETAIPHLWTTTTFPSPAAPLSMKLSVMGYLTADPSRRRTYWIVCISIHVNIVVYVCILLARLLLGYLVFALKRSVMKRYKHPPSRLTLYFIFQLVQMSDRHSLDIRDMCDWFFHMFTFLWMHWLVLAELCPDWCYFLLLSLGPIVKMPYY